MTSRVCGFGGCEVSVEEAPHLFDFLKYYFLSKLSALENFVCGTIR